jgi:hypothetical protein
MYKVTRPETAGCNRPDRAACVWGAKISSRRQDVLVEDTAETIPAHDASVTGCRRRCRRRSCLRGREGQRAMWPMPIVVIDEPL